MGNAIHESSCPIHCVSKNKTHDFYSAAALVVMESAVFATAIPSVRLSVRHTLVRFQTNEDRIMRSLL